MYKKNIHIRKERFTKFFTSFNYYAICRPLRPIVHLSTSNQPPAIHYTASHFCFSGPRSTAAVNYAIIKQTAGNDTCNDATNASKGSTIGVNTSTITLSLWLCVLPHRNEVIFSKPPQHQSPKQTYCRKSID